MWMDVLPNTLPCERWRTNYSRCQNSHNSASRNATHSQWRHSATWWSDQRQNQSILRHHHRQRPGPNSGHVRTNVLANFEVEQGPPHALRGWRETRQILKIGTLWRNSTDLTNCSCLNLTENKYILRMIDFSSRSRINSNNAYQMELNNRPIHQSVLSEIDTYWVHKWSLA